MKGIVIDYFRDKGFGFIKDENEDKRFFHIKNVNDSVEFLNNLEDYYYTDWIERKCHVVIFKPVQNEKGLNASDIHLTNQIFNDKSTIKEFEAKIVDIKYDVDTVSIISTGVKKGMSPPIGATAGDNGTFRIGYPESSRELNIYYQRIDDIGWGSIDVRDLVLIINDRSKITDKLIDTLNNKLVGKEIMITLKNNKWILKDHKILEI